MILFLSYLNLFFLEREALFDTKVNGIMMIKCTIILRKFMYLSILLLFIPSVIYFCYEYDGPSVVKVRKRRRKREVIIPILCGLLEVCGGREEEGEKFLVQSRKVWGQRISKIFYKSMIFSKMTLRMTKF